MKIPNSLPQFNNQTTLILVTGKQDADFFIASEGRIEEIDHFKITSPDRFTRDQKGFFKTRGGGKTLMAGSMKEKNNRKEVRDFLSTLLDHLKKAIKENSITDFILVRPPYMKNATEDKLPASVSKKLSLTIKGNVVGEHPKTILERVRAEIEKFKNAREVTLLKPEAKRLLDRSRQAREIIKGQA